MLRVTCNYFLNMVWGNNHLKNGHVPCSIHEISLNLVFVRCTESNLKRRCPVYNTVMQKEITGVF